jgi:hypothetical protein
MAKEIEKTEVTKLMCRIQIMSSVGSKFTFVRIIEELLERKVAAPV